jgi:hypothetical protein
MEGAHTKTLPLFYCTSSDEQTVVVLATGQIVTHVRRFSQSSTKEYRSRVLSSKIFQWETNKGNIQA